MAKPILPPFTTMLVGLDMKESVVFPVSHCPKCGYAIRWHDNLPVLGWLLLRGHCRDCDAAISWRYPAVEALSAGLWISALLVWPGAGGGLPDLWLPWAGLPLIALLLPLVLIDLDTFGCRSPCAAGEWCWPCCCWKVSVPWPNGCWDSLRWALAMPSWLRWVGHGWAPWASQR